MTTIEYSRNRWNPLPFIVLLAVLGVLGGLLLSSHAVERHGSDAELIRQCFRDGRMVQQWQSKNDPSVQCFVIDTGRECSRWSILIAQMWPSNAQGCKYRERTAFTPRNGNPSAVEKYLERDFTRISP